MSPVEARLAELLAEAPPVTDEQRAMVVRLLSAPPKRTSRRSAKSARTTRSAA